jgi:hypothetical protein
VRLARHSLVGKGKPVAVAVAILVVVLLLVGWLVGRGGGQSEVSRGDFTIYVHDDALFPRGGMDALIGGVLMVRDGCVVLGGEGVDPDQAEPVVWPSGTRISDDDPLTLELPSGAHLEVGQTVNGSGGERDASLLEVEIDPRCLTATNKVTVFNPVGSDVTVG